MPKAHEKIPPKYLHNFPRLGNVNAFNLKAFSWRDATKLSWPIAFIASYLSNRLHSYSQNASHNKLPNWSTTTVTGKYECWIENGCAKVWEKHELTAGDFCSTEDAKEKGAFRGYKVTNMASHAASLVYTLNAWSSCSFRPQHHQKISRKLGIK